MARQDDIGKWFMSPRTAWLLNTVGTDGFGEIVKTARLVETHRDVEHNNPSVQGIHKYVNAARVGDQTMRVELTVRDYLQNDGKTVVRQIASVDIKDMDVGSVSTGRTDKAGVDAELPVEFKKQVPTPRQARRTWIHEEASRNITQNLARFIDNNLSIKPNVLISF